MFCVPDVCRISTDHRSESEPTHFPGRGISGIGASGRERCTPWPARELQNLSAGVTRKNTRIAATDPHPLNTRVAGGTH